MKLLLGLVVIKSFLISIPFSRLLCLEVIVTRQNLMTENSVAQMNYRTSGLILWNSVTLFSTNTSETFSHEFSSKPKLFHLIQY